MVESKIIIIVPQILFQKMARAHHSHTHTNSHYINIYARLVSTVSVFVTVAQYVVSSPRNTPWRYSHAESLRFITGSNEYDCYSANYVYVSKYYIHASGIYVERAVLYTIRNITRGKTIWITVIMLFIYFTNRFTVYHYYYYYYCWRGCASCVLLRRHAVQYVHQSLLIKTLGTGLIKCDIFFTREM